MLRSRPDLSFGETTPIAQGQPQAGGAMAGMNVVLPRGVDEQGRVYFQALGMGMRPGGQLPDSAAIMRWDRATGAFEQVGQVKLQERRVETSGGRGNQMMRMRQTPLSPQDGWGVGWNGRVAAARSDGYYLEWIEPDGRRVRGDDVSYRPVRIRQAGSVMRSFSCPSAPNTSNTVSPPAGTERRTQTSPSGVTRTPRAANAGITSGHS